MSRFGPRYTPKRGFFPNNRAGDRAKRSVESRAEKPKKNEKPKGQQLKRKPFGNMTATVVPPEAVAGMIEALSN
ncbi:hypothetical protein EKK58_05645 [Candidatus Dependentiae bacterium]|nr:MAG: hypothetical protein EKK58_05645 [Candidatus Dependentiae bacterium]